MDVFNTISRQEYAHQNGLYIANRQLSWLVSGLLIVSFFIFWAGYKAGRRQSVPYSTPVSEEEVPVVDAVLPDQVIQSVVIKPQRATHLTPGLPTLSSEKYYANLASFDSKKAAQTLVDRLRTADVITYIKERVYHAPSGEQQVWYQVATTYFDDKNALEELVEILAKQEKLRDICFVCC